MKIWEILALVWIAAIVAALHSGCAAGPQLIPATAPNETTVTVTIDRRTSGGENPPPATATEEQATGTIAVTVWVDNHADASPSTTGNHVDASDIGNPHTTVSATGGGTP